MKALSIQQPWAWLIVNGFKDVENRTWRTDFRGPLLIHAGKKVDWSGRMEVIKRFGPILPGTDILGAQTGGIVGMVNLVNCVGNWNSPWFSGPFGFVLRYPKIFPFLPCPGRLGIFEVNRPGLEPLCAILKQ